MVADNSSKDGAVNSSEQVRSGKILAMTSKMDTSNFLGRRDRDGSGVGGGGEGDEGRE